jgi:hypothetical protein
MGIINHNIAIEECLWKDIEALVIMYEPELAAIINELDPSKNFPLFKIKYPFGAKIFEKGIFYLPTDSGETVSVNDAALPNKIKELLVYSDLPLGILLDHGTEVYAELEDRIFSLVYFTHGLQLGIWETFAPAAPFSVSAGARSLFMLPKITDTARHRKLASYNVGFHAPLDYFEQWETFTKIANHKNFSQPWHCEVIFFSAPWLVKAKNDPRWQIFYNFIWARFFQHLKYSRNKMVLDIVFWESFSRYLSKHRIRPNPAIVDTIKHLIFVAAGILPAFAPVNNNQAAPVDALLKVYLEEYGLKTYSPSMMMPKHFDINAPNDYVYYSLQVPTYMESVPKLRTPTSALSDLSLLVEFMDLFIKELLSNKFCTENFRCTQDFYNHLSKVQFDYFHSETNLNKGIYPSADLSKEDSSLLYMPPGYKQRKFCEKSAFARGCIRISNKFNK